MKKPLLPHNLKERENDLIGNYFEIYRKAPKYQFGNKPINHFKISGKAYTTRSKVPLNVRPPHRDTGSV